MRNLDGIGMETTSNLQIRGTLLDSYGDVLTPAALAAIAALQHFDDDRRQLMLARTARRARRQRDRERITFLPAEATIGRRSLSVGDARAGRFEGSEIPADLQRQWIQGTGPAARPRARLAESIRNVAYALLSGADGWMFDGEDALGQVDSMSLDNQRNLKLAFAARLAVPGRRRAGCRRDERMGGGVSSAGAIIQRLADAARLHDANLSRARPASRRSPHPARPTAARLSASIVDVALYIVHNREVLRREGRSLVLYLPKIQMAEEAALWNDILDALEQHLGLPSGAIKVYVLVEQVEASFQLMEIRAALGAALRRLQYRPVGLHQQPLGRRRPGIRPSSIPTSTRSR